MVIRAVFNRVLKVILSCFGFALLRSVIGLKKPPTQPIRCKTKTNRDLVTRIFPRLAQVTCICFEFSLVFCFFVYVCCDLLYIVVPEIAFTFLIVFIQ